MTKASGILPDMHTPPEPSLLVLNCMALFRSPLNAQAASSDTESGLLSIPWYKTNCAAIRSNYSVQRMPRDQRRLSRFFNRTSRDQRSFVSFLQQKQRFYAESHEHLSVCWSSITLFGISCLREYDTLYHTQFVVAEVNSSQIKC